ncbi:MAG TPA: chorismate-binding protein [Culturomica sp.]|nr:chorismate-binding protein [Culturomica sp.]
MNTGRFYKRYIYRFSRFEDVMRESMQFIETIKISEGYPCHLEFHIRRMQETLQSMGMPMPELQAGLFLPPAGLRNGVVKCRVVYDPAGICGVEFAAYRPRVIRALKVVDDDDIVYPYKSADRSMLMKLYEKRGDCDDVLIVKDGFLTDTSYSNVVLSRRGEFYTPDTYLLNGTKRRFLLQQGLIRACPVRVADLYTYDRVYLINAMLDLEDEVAIPVDRIVK